MSLNIKRIGVFASGSGTNAENIIRFFANNPGIEVRRIYSNKKDAGVFERAGKYNIDCQYFTKEDFRSESFMKQLSDIDFIVLAGFLWLVPSYLVRNFKNRIINIHPALLPSYGGKGMYGMNVHRAVIEAGEKKSGISIHYVNEEYDEGSIIFQAEVDIAQDETPESLAGKIHELEYRHFPEVIKNLVTSL